MAAAFAKVFQAAVRATADKLSLTERGALWTLTAYIGRQDTVIRNLDGAPMTGTEIARVLGMSQPNTSRVLSQLVKAGVLTEQNSGRGKQYAISAFLAHRYPRR